MENGHIMNAICCKGERMNFKWMAIVAVLLPVFEAGAQETGEALSTQKDKVSYGIGVNAAQGFKRLQMDLDLELVIRGLRDGYAGAKLLISEDEIRKVVAAYQQEVAVKQTAAARIAAEKNKREGDAFLEENKKKEGVVTLPSGLQYKILKAGEGKTPTEKDMVQVHYAGTLIDGTEFDSSLPHGQPLTFPLVGVIAGWREALKLMPVGSKWQLFIPPSLAYGTRGSGDKIGPNATLIFEVELLDIKQSGEKPAPASKP
jgi:FKBP-type peptidyl-prolyl cis-trans isomerase FklB